MSRIRPKSTQPELAVRRLIHSLGYRYSLHIATLAGTPDLVFRARKKVIFVHGCFWHRHRDCALARLPKSRLEFWMAKLEGNRRRDSRNETRLRRAGWGCMTIWECQIVNPERLVSRIVRFLDKG